MTVRRKRHVNATRARLCRASDARRPRRRHPVREPGCGTRGPPPGLRAPALLARCRMRVQAPDAHRFFQSTSDTRHPFSSPFVSRVQRASRPQKAARMAALRSLRQGLAVCGTAAEWPTSPVGELQPAHLRVRPMESMRPVHGAQSDIVEGMTDPASRPASGRRSDGTGGFRAVVASSFAHRN